MGSMALVGYRTVQRKWLNSTPYFIEIFLVVIWLIGNFRISELQNCITLDSLW